MSKLALLSAAHGLILLVLSTLLAALPRRVSEILHAFPRSTWPGRILSAFDTAWFTALLLAAGINWVDEHRLLVKLLAIALWIAVIFWMPEFLSVRAFGALLLLAAHPIIEAAFTYHSATKLVMTTYAYLLVVLGCIIVWSPYLFRKWLLPAVATELRARITACFGALFGVAMLVLAFGSY